ncbi:hypothetical protein HWV62_2296 [Athelia sp. TMB]|nr:hypothetical protein HWV62_2296 [Athelia sp. TMB]
MPTQSKPIKPVQLTPLAAALAGALGGCFSNAVVYPLDVAKTRIQASTDKGKGKSADASMLPVLLKILKEEGLAGWYRGFAATMLNTFSMQYAYFFFYSFVRNTYIKRITAALPSGAKVPALSTAAELALGALAGALAQIFTIPVSVIATRQQVGRQSAEEAAAEGPRDDSFLGVAREIIREEGVTGLWLGIKPGLVLTVNPAITYGMFERVKSVLLLAKAKAGSGDKLTPGLSFLVGALSKTLATIVRIQARSADEEDGVPPLAGYHHAQKQHPSAVSILAKVLKKKGVTGWYQGMSAQIIKAVLSQALLFMSKDQFELWAQAIIVQFMRLSR